MKSITHILWEWVERNFNWNTILCALYTGLYFQLESKKEWSFSQESDKVTRQNWYCPSWCFNRLWTPIIQKSEPYLNLKVSDIF